jgi:hypothetical protein
MPGRAFEERRRSLQAGACEAENRNHTLRPHRARCHENRLRDVEFLSPVAEMSQGPPVGRARAPLERIAALFSRCGEPRPALGWMKLPAPIARRRRP